MSGTNFNARFDIISYLPIKVTNLPAQASSFDSYAAVDKCTLVERLKSSLKLTTGDDKYSVKYFRVANTLPMDIGANYYRGLINPKGGGNFFV